jgi:hypothetical protein
MDRLTRYIVQQLQRDIFGIFYIRFQQCFICRPSDSTVSEDAGIESRTVANFGTDSQTL